MITFFFKLLGKYIINVIILFNIDKFFEKNILLLLFFQKQAWNLSAIKREPNLSIQIQIHLKKAFSSQKATSNLTQVFLDKKQFQQKSNYCLLGPSRSF